jgi:hypothetical protein
MHFVLLSWIPVPNLAIGWAVIPVEMLGKVCIVACKIPTMAASLWLQNCKLLSKLKEKASLPFFLSFCFCLFFISSISCSSQSVFHLCTLLFISISSPSLPSILSKKHIQSPKP